MIEDRCLVGSGSVVRTAVVRSGGLVGANAVVPTSSLKKPRSPWPSASRQAALDAVPPGEVRRGGRAHVERGRRYRDELRQIDG